MKYLHSRVTSALFSIVFAAAVFSVSPMAVHAEEAASVAIESTTTENKETLTQENISNTEYTTDDTTNSTDTRSMDVEEDIDNDADDIDDDVDDLTVPSIKEETIIIHQTTAQIKRRNAARWTSICEGMLKNFKRKHFKYGNGKPSKTYESAVSKKRRANCALYVSWCLQKYGALDPGDLYYVKGSGKIHKNFKHWGKNVKVIRSNKKCRKAGLQKGDIVCWKGNRHTNIFAGKNSKGEYLWYDGGKISTKANRSGSRYTRTGRQPLDYLYKRKISYIIRLTDI